MSEAAGSRDRQELPIGIQTFRKIREGGYSYVDKTAFAERLIEEGSDYFLSRPRRFGKSLFLDTLKELFEGNEPLFRGLHIHDRWDWFVRRPVIKLSVGAGTLTSLEAVQISATRQIERLARLAGVPAPSFPLPHSFPDLIESVADHAGRRVVVLVDEYDKPILDAISDPRAARINRDFLLGLYGPI